MQTCKTEIHASLQPKIITTRFKRLKPEVFADSTSLLQLIIVWILLLQHSTMTWWSYKIGHTNGKSHATQQKQTGVRDLTF